MQRPNIKVLQKARDGLYRPFPRHRRAVSHQRFEWNDGEAARQHRLWQARHLANSWRVEIVYQDRGEQTRFLAPGLVNVKLQEPTAGGADRAYIPIQTALDTPEYRAQLLADAKRRLDYWRVRFEAYRRLPEFAALEPVFEAIEQVSEADAETVRP